MQGRVKPFIKLLALWNSRGNRAYLGMRQICIRLAFWLGSYQTGLRASATMRLLMATEPNVTMCLQDELKLVLRQCWNFTRWNRFKHRSDSLSSALRTSARYACFYRKAIRTGYIIEEDDLHGKWVNEVLQSSCPMSKAIHASQALVYTYGCLISWCRWSISFIVPVDVTKEAI